MNGGKDSQYNNQPSEKNNPHQLGEGAVTGWSTEPVGDIGYLAQGNRTA